jgi:hypothetical protein
MDRILADAGLRRRMSEDGAASVRSNTWDENFRKTRLLLERLL